MLPVGEQKNTYQLGYFPYKTIKSYPTSLAHNSVYINGPSGFKFGTETNYMVLQATLKFGRN